MSGAPSVGRKSVTIRHVVELVMVAWIALMPDSASAQAMLPKGAGPAGPPPTAPCSADPTAPIDFQGTLGHASGSSSVKIFQASDVADFYLGTIASKYGSGPQTQPSVSTIAELQQVERNVERIPALLASAHTAGLSAGNFKCIGFAPGRYVFFAQVYGSGAQAQDSPGGITFYRADVDVSSLRRHAIVVVRGFRRIGAYPPAS